MPAARRPTHTLSYRRAYASLALGVFAIGWSAILVRWAGTSGMVSAFYRLLFASFVFIPWRLTIGRHLAPPSPKARRVAMVAGVFFGADLAFFNTAVMTTSATNATLLGVNAPIFVALGAWAMYGQRPTTRYWLGFLLAFSGMTAIVGMDVLIHPSLGLGDLFAVIGALCYGVYLLYVQRGRETMDTLTFSAWAAAVGALCLLPVCLATGQQLGGFSGRSWAALIGLALTTQVVGHLLIAHSMGRLPATSSSIVLLAQAPMTALLAWPLLGEPITVWQIVGGILVLAGIMVVNVTRTGAPRPSALVVARADEIPDRRAGQRV
jgi:drug/metabolite transporter (DMT)-like permease